MTAGWLCEALYSVLTVVHLTIVFIDHDTVHMACLKHGIANILGSGLQIDWRKEPPWQVFPANGYPAQMVNRTLRNHPAPSPFPSTQTEEQEQTVPKFLNLPYVRGVSERIERKCRSFVIRTIFKSKETLTEALVLTKEPQPQWKKKGVVYTRCHVSNVIVFILEKPEEHLRRD